MSISNPVFNLITKMRALPVTAIGVAYGLLNYPFGARITIGHNAIEFNNVLGKSDNALTLGNSILYAQSSAGSDFTRLQMGAYDDVNVNVGLHEEGHTWQFQRLGPLYPVFYLNAGPFGNINNPYENAANIYGRGSIH